MGLRTALLAGAFLMPAAANATVYYVSAATGRDHNNGTSPSAPLATIQAAADKTNPGDIVQIMDGRYTSAHWTVVAITRSGADGLPITYMPYLGHHPIIDSTGTWSGFTILGASYITVQGLEFVGNTQNLRLEYAQSQKDNTNNPTTSGGGIDVKQSESGAHPLHIVIQNNLVHDVPGAGIAATNADYVSILNNTVYNCAWYAPFAESGITVGKGYNSDADTGYKMIITGNRTYNNQNRIPWHVKGKITDGNGIIIDSDNDTGYAGRTLVANNVSYKNGGTGMHAINSSHVDFLFNTAYGNNTTPTLNEGQIGGQGNSTDVFIENNILVAPSGKVVNEKSPAGVTYDYNLYFGGTGPRVIGPHDLQADPKFTNQEAADFTLQAGSPAIHAANPAYKIATDVQGALLAVRPFVVRP